MNEACAKVELSEAPAVLWNGHSPSMLTQTTAKVPFPEQIKTSTAMPNAQDKLHEKLLAGTSVSCQEWPPHVS